MKRLLVLLLLLIGAAVVVAWAALDDQPHAEPGGKITRGDLLWAKHLFEKNVPRHAPPTPCKRWRYRKKNSTGC